MRSRITGIILRATLCFIFSGTVLFALAQYDKVVAADGTGDFTTIQAAILAAPLNPTIPYKVFIKNGDYHEKVTINRPLITLVGENVAHVLIWWDDYYMKVPGLQPKSTATVTINANDVVMMNISVENRSANTADGPQALALNVNRDRCAFKNCRFIGAQDTIATDRGGTRQYFKDCYIDGNTDFIYGASTALFEDCIIFPRDRIDGGSGGYVTAANTPINQAYGYVFMDCIIPENRGISTSYSLGRPWGNDGSTADQDKAHNQTVFLNTVMGSSIKPEGWSVWNSGTNTDFINYAEYKSAKVDGSPVDVGSRVSWSKQLTEAEAATYTKANILTNSSGTWDPCTITADFCDDAASIIALSNFRAKAAATTVQLTGNIDWPIADVNAALMRSTDNVSYEKIDETLLSLAHYNFSFTTDLPATGTTYYYKVVGSKSGYEDFATDTIQVTGTPVVVPLKLTAFSASVEASAFNTVKLEWATTGETNTLYTIVERTNADGVFEAIGKVQAANTRGPHSYTFFDRSMDAEKAFYRLKMVDATGDFSYSNIREVALAISSRLAAYPNPVIGGFTVVSHPKAIANTQISFATLKGEKLFDVPVRQGSIRTQLDLSKYPKGMYLLSFKTNQTADVLRVVIP